MIANGPNWYDTELLIVPNLGEWRIMADRWNYLDNRVALAVVVGKD